MTKYNILLIGSVPSEFHVLSFKKEHPNYTVFTLDERGRLEDDSHFLVDFNKMSNIVEFYTEIKRREILFNFIIFDASVVKFIKDEFIFQALLVVFNNILQKGGTLLMECCVLDSFLADSSTYTFKSLPLVPNRYSKSFTGKKQEVKDTQSFRNEHPENISMLASMMEVFNTYGFKSKHESNIVEPYPLRTKDPVRRYIVAEKVRQVADLIELKVPIPSPLIFYIGIEDRSDTLPDTITFADKYLKSAKKTLEPILSELKINMDRVFIFGNNLHEKSTIYFPTRLSA